MAPANLQRKQDRCEHQLNGRQIFFLLCPGPFQRLNFKPKTPVTGHVESCVQLEAAAFLLPNSNLHLSGVCRVPATVCAPRRHKAQARAVRAGRREERQRSVVSASSALPTPSSKVGQLNKSVSKCPVWNDQFGNPFDWNQSSRGIPAMRLTVRSWSRRVGQRQYRK